MKILFFTENFPPETNAAATRVFERAVYWIKSGHEVTIITSAPNFPYGKIYDGYKNRYQKEIFEGINVTRVRTYIAPNTGVFGRTIDFLSFMFMSYFAAKHERRPDIVISTSPQFFAAVAAWWFAKKQGLRYVFELGDLWPESIHALKVLKSNFLLRILEKLELKMYKDADAIIALTNAFKNNLVQRNVAGEKIVVIKNGVDTWRYAPQKRDRELAKQLSIRSHFVVGYVGTIGMAHALESVLHAAEKLIDFRNIYFLFAGEGASYNDIKNIAEKWQLPNTGFLPKQPKTKMRRVWSLCDVALVHLKDAEIFSTVIPSKMFEAMSMGLPILFSGPRGEASKIIESTSAGICIPPESPGILAKKILSLAQNPELCGRLAQKSLAAAPMFSRETQANQVISVLKSVIKGRRSKASKIMFQEQGTHE